MSAHNCPDRQCKFTTQKSERMTHHIQVTNHGKRIKEFKGFKNSKTVSKPKH